MGDAAMALRDCDTAVGLDESFSRAYLRRIHALQALQQYQVRACVCSDLGLGTAIPGAVVCSGQRACIHAHSRSVLACVAYAFRFQGRGIAQIRAYTS